jgi:dihydroxyacetone kinase-like protein
MKIKKIINSPDNVWNELLEGAVEASNGSLVLLENSSALVKRFVPDGKVALLIGGGSGHEPLFPGFVGENMADGAACGPIFTAPPPDIIYDSTRYLDRGKGVLYLYGNYAGDNMSFDLAAEQAMKNGINVKTVRVWDDVASAPLENKEERRGIAGDLLVIKVSGGAAAVLDDIEDVYRIAVKARDNTRSIGVSLAAGSIPETGELTFELGDDEVEIGMGLHGEPGISREKMLPADLMVEKMMDKLLVDFPVTKGDDVVLLINNLGSTTMMELLIANRKATRILKENDIRIHETIVGTYCTCQEMAGLSISLMKVDDELKRFFDMPAKSIGFNKR